jgi:hypothetical protein
MDEPKDKRQNKKISKMKKEEYKKDPTVHRMDGQLMNILNNPKRKKKKSI